MRIPSGRLCIWGIWSPSGKKGPWLDAHEDGQEEGEQRTGQCSTLLSWESLDCYEKSEHLSFTPKGKWKPGWTSFFTPTAMTTYSLTMSSLLHFSFPVERRMLLAVDHHRHSI